MLHGIKKTSRFNVGLAQKLPPAYRKFYAELTAKPTAVHFIPKEGQFERDEVTGIVKPIQNIPIPVIYPPEANEGIWGGEGVVKGFQKRSQTRRRVPHYWVPVLRRSVVHSQVLDKYMSMVVTNRTMDLIHESRGFDHYLLKTPACDLKSTLALKLKRNILQALQSGCVHLGNDPRKQSDIITEYKQYLAQYTPEEIEWYGLTFKEAIYKIKKILQDTEPIVAQKYEFRSKLLQRLKEVGISEVKDVDVGSDGQATSHSHLPQQ